MNIWEFVKGVFEWAWGFIMLIAKTIAPAWPIFVVIFCIIVAIIIIRRKRGDL